MGARRSAFANPGARDLLLLLHLSESELCDRGEGGVNQTSIASPLWKKEVTGSMRIVQGGNLLLLLLKLSLELLLLAEERRL